MLTTSHLGVEASESPLASSFQTMTIAIQRAKPIKIKPIAIGILVVPMDTATLKDCTAAGNRKPMPTPTAIAKEIHSIR